jgi:hypothetical protein
MDSIPEGAKDLYVGSAISSPVAEQIIEPLLSMSSSLK